jgi:hypothetical protein
MLSFSVSAARRGFLALGLASVAVALPIAAQQPAGHDSTMSKMPGMQMGKVTTKKKAAAPRKRATSAKKKKVGGTTAAKTRSSPKKTSSTKPTPNSTHAGPGQKPDSMAGMQMKAPPSAPRGDTAQINPSEMAGMPGMPTARHDTSDAKNGMQTGMNMPGMQGHTTEDMMIGPAGVSMERMGSGTTWIPDAVTLPNRRRMLGDWMIMAHGFAFVQYDKQGGERGNDQFGSLNWLMLMATHDARGGRFQARTMLSLDPLTVTNRGYPLLLQSGETFNGEPLHDRQHPHDFWMELGALYERSITKSLAWSFYAAPSGEPALGPVAFMHRPSAMDNPAAPISHHWQDASHVTFGVLTTGIYTHTWQVEGSVFNGREPNQNRWGFDPIRLDSYSGRATVNPNRHWSLEAGYGYLKSPEALNPAESMHRITASIQHGARLGSDGQVATTLVWGANKHSSLPGLSNSVLLESESILDRRNTLFGRSEFVQKSAEEIVVADPILTRSGQVLPGLPTNERFNLGTFQLGYIREAGRTHWATIGLGLAATLNFVTTALEPYYGSRTPAGMFVFLRLRPFHIARKAMTDMRGMDMNPKHE